jgi:hypothetical protein
MSTLDQALPVLGRAQYDLLEQLSFQLRDEALGLFMAGDRDGAYAVYLSDPLGNAAPRATWEPWMEGCVAAQGNEATAWLPRMAGAVVVLPRAS